MNKSKLKCKNCENHLFEDKKAIYFHWRYYCKKCDGFITDPKQIIRTLVFQIDDLKEVQ